MAGDAYMKFNVSPPLGKFYNAAFSCLLIRATWPFISSSTTPPRSSASLSDSWIWSVLWFIKGDSILHFLVKRPSSHKEASAPFPRALESEVLQQKDLWCIPDLHSLCVSHYLPLDTVTGFHSKGTQGRSLHLPEQGDFFSANGMERDESLTSHVVRPPPLHPFWQRSTSLPHCPPALLLGLPTPASFPFQYFSSTTARSGLLGAEVILSYNSAPTSAAVLCYLHGKQGPAFCNGSVNV